MSTTFLKKNEKKEAGKTADWERRTAQELQCSLCRGELYPGDPYYELEGRIVCEDCIGRYAGRYFAHRLRRVGRGERSSPR